MNPCQCSKQDLNQFHVFHHPSSETQKGGCIAVKMMAQAGVIFQPCACQDSGLQQGYCKRLLEK